MKVKLLFIFIVFNSFWIILTGRITPESIIIGLIVTGVIIKLNFSIFLDLIKKPYFSFDKFRILLRYILLLMREIVIANFQVAKIVLNPKIKIKPQVIHYKTTIKDPLLRAILANSITLTPGTLTIEVINDILIIHCLTPGHALGVNNSKLEKLLIEIEG